MTKATGRWPLLRRDLPLTRKIMNLNKYILYICLTIQSIDFFGQLIAEESKKEIKVQPIKTSGQSKTIKGLMAP